MIALARLLRPGRRGLGRPVLLLVVLTAGVIVGLLAMHALDTTSAHTEVAAAASVHDMGAAAHGEPQSQPDDGCADCGEHALLAMGCVLALLVGLMLLALPRLGIAWTAPLRRAGPLSMIHAAPSKPPSLLVLCISRT